MSARLQAMIDVVVDDERGLESITKLDNAKLILEGAASQLSTPIEVLNRIRYSLHAHELMRHLPHIVGQTRESLEPYAQALVANARSWDEGLLAEFADLYWSTRVSERIHRGDFRRGWDELRKAYQGFNPKALEPGKCIQAGETSNLAASYACIEALLMEMHGAMHKKRLVGEISQDPIPFNDLVGPGYKAYRDSSFTPIDPEEPRRLFPGEVFVRATVRSGMIPATGQAAYQIAKYLSSKRDNKRNQKVKKKMSK